MKFFRYLALLLCLAVLPTAVIAGTGYYPAGGGGGGGGPVDLAGGPSSVTGILPATNGGTGVSANYNMPSGSIQSGYIFYANALNSVVTGTPLAGGIYTPTSAGTSGQILRSAGLGNAPTWSTATFPATAGTSGNVLTSNGTNFVSQAPAGAVVNASTNNAPKAFGTGTMGAWNDLVGTGADNFSVANFTGHDTGASANDSAYLDVNVPSIGVPNQARGNRWIFRVRTGSSISSIRIWAICTDGSISSFTTSATPTGNNVLGFRFSTDVDGTNFWRTWANDGSGAGTAFTTTQAIATNTEYLMCIDASNPASITYYINGNLVDTRTTDIPASTVSLNSPRFGLTTLAAGAKTLFGSLSWYTDYSL